MHRVMSVTWLRAAYQGAVVLALSSLCIILLGGFIASLLW